MVELAGTAKHWDFVAQAVAEATLGWPKSSRLLTRPLALRYVDGQMGVWKSVVTSFSSVSCMQGGSAAHVSTPRVGMIIATNQPTNHLVSLS